LGYWFKTWIRKAIGCLKAMFIWAKFSAPGLGRGSSLP
jgi:hypothetical protein